MAKLKVYTLGIHGFINPQVRDALDLPPHIREADVYVSAPTKVAAVQVLADRGFPHCSTRDPEFRVATGNTVAGLLAAGLFAKPTVIVTPDLAGRGDRVVEMQPGGTLRLIGYLTSRWPDPDEFTPKEN